MSEPTVPSLRLSSWSTTQNSKNDAADHWQHIRQQAYVDVSTDPLTSDFHGEVTLGRFPSFALSIKRAGGEDVWRSRSHIAQGDERDEYLYTVFQVSGTCVLEQFDRTAVVPPGSAVIYDSSAPFVMHNAGPYEQVIVELPADEAFARAGVSRGNDLLARTLPCDGAVSAVASFFVNLAQSQIRDPEGAVRLEPHASDLAFSTLNLVTPTTARADLPGAARREQAIAYMRANLSDPSVDATSIAEGIHISRRSLYREFQGTGDSVIGVLRELRVEQAKRLLLGSPNRPVSSIARDTGFSSVAHFYRVFRASTSMTPGEYRAQGLPRGL